MGKVRQRKQDMIDREIAFHVNAYKQSGVDLIMGSGRFVGPKTIRVDLAVGGTRLLTGNEIVVNVGSYAAIPDIPGLKAARALTHIETLELGHLPSHLIVLGGGYVGIEMAQAYRRFGSQVTIVEPGRQLMRREDADVAEEILQMLRGEGIEILVNVKPVSVEGRSGEAVAVTVRTPEGDQKIDGSDLLVAVGRVANTDGIGLLEAGIELDARGLIRVDERLKTTSAGVLAIGECAGSPQFTHVSVDDFRIVRDNMEGGNRTTGGRLVPYVMFTDPPLARVGLSEGEARLQGIPVRVAKLPMSNVLRTEATDETRGFMKVVVGADDDTILGFTMTGSEAGEVMAAIQTAIWPRFPTRSCVTPLLPISRWPKASVRSLGICRRGVPPSAESLRCSIMRALSSDGARGFGSLAPTDFPLRRVSLPLRRSEGGDQWCMAANGLLRI